MQESKERPLNLKAFQHNSLKMPHHNPAKENVINNSFAASGL